MRLDVVPMEWVNNVWPNVEPFFVEAAKHGDDYSVEQLKVFATQGSWMLLVMVNDDNEITGGMLINFFNRPNARIAFVIAIGGKLISTQELFEQLKRIVTAHGATEIEGAARESVARLWRQHFGFKEKYRIVGVKL